MAAPCSTPSSRASAKRARQQARRAESLSGSIRQFLTPEVWKQARQAAHAAGCRNDPRWSLQPLILTWAMMTWCAGQTDAERFLTVRTFYVRVHSPKRNRPGKYFSGFHKAVRRLPMTVWWAVGAAVAANSSAPWPTGWSSTAGPPSGATARASSARAPSNWRTTWGGRANPAVRRCSGSRRWSASAPGCSGPGGWGRPRRASVSTCLTSWRTSPGRPGAGPAGLRRRLRQL